jgi:hypothetical protein
MHRLSASVLLACLLTPVLAFAQDGGPLTFGEAVTGEITDDTPEVRYTFDGVAGDIITVNMSAEPGTLDSYLELIAPDGTKLLTADDYAGSLNSQIGPYTLADSGTYNVVATRCCGGGRGGTTGAYDLVIRHAEVAPLTVGETVTASLSDDRPGAFFSVEGGPQAVLTLEAQTAEGDTPFLVEVRNPEGQVVNSGWQNFGQPVLIDPLFLGGEGSYLINVSRQQNTTPEATPTSSSVTVSLALQVVETQPIEIGATVNGTLDESNPSDHYSFSGTPDDLLRLSGVQAPNGEPFEVIVHAPNGFSINSANTGYTQDAGRFTLDPLQLFESGEYLLVLRRLDTEGDGEMGASNYTLTLGVSESPILQAGTAMEETVGGQTYERVYRYEGTAGQVIRITLRSASDSYGPALTVQGPNVQVTDPVESRGMGSPFTFNISSSVPATAIYEVTLPEDGTYLFRVNNGAYNQEGPAVGGFSLLIEIIR